MKKNLYLKIFLIFIFLFLPNIAFSKKIPNLIGKWEGENIKSSIKKGFVKSNNIVEITEQKNRLFKGYVIHKNGKQEFVGVIKSDLKGFFWADSSDDDGKVIGTIINKKKSRFENVFVYQNKKDFKFIKSIIANKQLNVKLLSISRIFLNNKNQIYKNLPYVEGGISVRGIDV